MTDGRLRVAALAAIAAALAGCGGGSRPSRADNAPAVAPPTVSTLTARPRPADGATTCTVYESGFATEVVFESQLLDVRGECRAWASGQPGSGYLFGYETAVGSAAEAVGSTPVCSLTDPDQTAAVSVVEDGGFVPVSAAQFERGSTACARLLAAGWTKRPR